MLEEFSQELIKEEKSPATREKYLRDTQRFLDFVGDRELDKNVVLDYKSELAKKYKVSSVNSMLASVNAYLSFIERTDCHAKPMKVQKSAFCSEQQELSKEEYIRLISVASDRMALIIQTICGTGIRISELEYVTVEALEKGETTVCCKGKTRTVFIVNKLRRKLLAYAKKNKIESGPVFVTRSGQPLNRSNVWKQMKSLCEKAEVNPMKVYPHNLRHLFARTFYDVEHDIAKLADILGHSNINTTRIYIVETGVEHKKKLEKMKLII